jgi:hypothetical protein
MYLSAALRERDREDFDRIERAGRNPKRRDAGEPLDSRLECTLGRMRSRGQITEAEFQSGLRWRGVYSRWLKSIESPDEVTDSDAEAAQKKYRQGLEILEAFDGSSKYKKRKRVVHAVNSVCVFEDPEELGDFEFTAAAAKVGLSDLAKAGF